MAKLTINRGTVANDGTGDNLRAGANKVNLNFDEIYTTLGDGTTLDGTIKVADDSSTVSTLSANGETLRILGGNAITTTISGNDLTIAADTASLLTGTGVATLTNKDLTDASNTFPTISIKDDASTIDTVNLGQTITFEGGAGITTTVTDNKVSYAADVSATSTTTLTNKTINGPDNTLTNIANSSLANSSITLGDDTIALGGTDTSIANLSLTGATGTIDLTSQANKIRFNYNGTSSFPDSSNYEGMFAYDYAGDEAYVADAGGWVKLINENASIADLSNVGSIGSISDQDILVFNSTTGRFDPKAQKINAVAEIDVTANGSAAFLFNSHYSGNNPTLYLRAGSTYAFNLDIQGHPFAFQTVSGAYDAANVYTTGLTHIAKDGTISTGSSALLQTSGTLYIEIPSGTSSTIYYVCQAHSAMAGTLNLQSDTTTGGLSDVASDTTPQLGGDLDAQTNSVQDVAYVSHRSPDATVTKTLTVTVASKTSEHYRFGQGSSNGYVIDGHESPMLQLSPGTYRFDQSDASNATHPLRIYYDDTRTKIFSTNVTTAGTPGSAGAYTEILIEGGTPTPLYYQCTAHAYMGHGISLMDGRYHRINFTDVDKFTGDNTTTVFAIEPDRSVLDCFVFVNGICLVPTDDYTISGSNMTFITAPATGAEITIRYIG